MAVISFINLKGGVGKTTCCVALAEFLAGKYQRHVLVIDLDPQTNATTALIGSRRWIKQEEAGQTLRQMFLDQFIPERYRTFHLADAIFPRASNVHECQPNLWLLPSSLKLIGLEAVVEMVHAVSEYQIEPYEVLAQHLTKTLQLSFDDILIDCPPSLNAITLNGLYLSDAYIIPVYPEPISEMGIPQILGRVQRLQTKFARLVPSLGILVNRLDLGSKRQKQEQFVSYLRHQPDYPLVFDEIIPQRQQIIQAMQNEIPFTTVDSKYSDDGTPPTQEVWRRFAKEFLQRCSSLTK